MALGCLQCHIKKDLHLGNVVCSSIISAPVLYQHLWADKKFPYDFNRSPRPLRLREPEQAAGADRRASVGAEAMASTLCPGWTFDYPLPDCRGCVPICGCGALGVLLPGIFPKCNSCAPSLLQGVKQSLPSWDNWEICLRSAHLTQPKPLLYTYIFTLGGLDVGYIIIQVGQSECRAGGHLPLAVTVCWQRGSSFIAGLFLDNDNWYMQQKAWGKVVKPGELRGSRKKLLISHKIFAIYNNKTGFLLYSMHTHIYTHTNTFIYTTF